MSGYRDPRVVLEGNEVELTGYYVPWGTKRIRDDEVVAVSVRELGNWSGRYRIWGTSDPRYWYPLDPGRPSKKVAFVFDLGTRVKPVVTPDDPTAFTAELKRCGIRILDVPAVGG